jgi:hypothetical protein
MKVLYIERGRSTDEGTFGNAVMGDLQWISLELPDRGNCTGISCIPAGHYTAVRKHSDHFGYDVFLLQGVPGRTNVEIHRANFAGDTTKGWHSDLLGCIALGMHQGLMQSPDGKMQQAIYSSRVALDQLMADAGDMIEVYIKDAPT